MMHKRARKFQKVVSLTVSIIFLWSQCGFAQMAAELNIAGYLGQLHSGLNIDKFRPPHLRYFSLDPANNNIKILLDKGDVRDASGASLKQSAAESLKYFLIGITLPDENFWVNLRPDAQDNIIPDILAQTDVGKILLEADLQLKKDTALMTSPETLQGKLYWDKLYEKAGELFGQEAITIPTLTRPWIVPDEIIIREHEGSAFVFKATLKVMLEQDYLKGSSVYSFSDPRLKELNEYSSELIRAHIIPQLTKEVNTAKRYAALRQVFYSLVLARWFKTRFYGKAGLYASFINKQDLTGLTSTPDWSKTTYFNAYQKSFKDGEYNLKFAVPGVFGQSMRTYFSGGIQIGENLSLLTEQAGSPIAAFSGRRDFFSAAQGANMAGFTNGQRVSSPAEALDRLQQLSPAAGPEGRAAASPVASEQKIVLRPGKVVQLTQTLGSNSIVVDLSVLRRGGRIVVTEQSRDPVNIAQLAFDAYFFEGQLRINGAIGNPNATNQWLFGGNPLVSPLMYITYNPVQDILKLTLAGRKPEESPARFKLKMIGEAAIPAASPVLIDREVHIQAVQKFLQQPAVEFNPHRDYVEFKNDLADRMFAHFALYLAGIVPEEQIAFFRSVKKNAEKYQGEFPGEYPYLSESPWGLYSDALGVFQEKDILERSAKIARLLEYFIFGFSRMQAPRIEPDKFLADPQSTANIFAALTQQKLEGRQAMVAHATVLIAMSLSDAAAGPVPAAPASPEQGREAASPVTSVEEVLKDNIGKWISLKQLMQMTRLTQEKLASMVPNIMYRPQGEYILEVRPQEGAIFIEKGNIWPILHEQKIPVQETAAAAQVQMQHDIVAISLSTDATSSGAPGLAAASPESSSPVLSEEERQGITRLFDKIKAQLERDYDSFLGYFLDNIALDKLVDMLMPRLTRGILGEEELQFLGRQFAGLPGPFIEEFLIRANGSGISSENSRVNIETLVQAQKRNRGTTGSLTKITNSEIFPEGLNGLTEEQAPQVDTLVLEAQTRIEKLLRTEGAYYTENPPQVIIGKINERRVSLQYPRLLQYPRSEEEREIRCKLFIESEKAQSGLDLLATFTLKMLGQTPMQIGEIDVQKELSDGTHLGLGKAKNIFIFEQLADIASLISDRGKVTKIYVNHLLESGDNGWEIYVDLEGKGRYRILRLSVPPLTAVPSLTELVFTNSRVEEPTAGSLAEAQKDAPTAIPEQGRGAASPVLSLEEQWSIELAIEEIAESQETRETRLIELAEKLTKIFARDSRNSLGEEDKIFLGEKLSKLDVDIMDRLIVMILSYIHDTGKKLHLFAGKIGDLNNTVTSARSRRQKTGSAASPVATGKIKEILNNLQEHLPYTDPLVWEFGKYLSRRLPKRLDPKGFISEFQEALSVLQNRVDFITWQPVALLGLSNEQYDAILQQLPNITLKLNTTPELSDFSNRVIRIWNANSQRPETVASPVARETEATYRILEEILTSDKYQNLVVPIGLSLDGKPFNIAEIARKFASGAAVEIDIQVLGFLGITILRGYFTISHAEEIARAITEKPDSVFSVRYEDNHFIVTHKNVTSSPAVGSPATQVPPETTGGIDLTRFNSIIQPTGSFCNLEYRLPSREIVQAIDLDEEFRQIEQMVENGILPSSERIKEFLACCYYRKELAKRADDLFLCLIKVCRLEEENAYTSNTALRESLVLVDAL